MSKHIQIAFNFDDTVGENKKQAAHLNPAILPPPPENILAPPAAPIPSIEEDIVAGKKRGRPPLSIADHVVSLQIPEDEILYKKQYYTIGQVAEMFQENVSLIRFWENQFDILKPKKNGKGDRLFRPEDVKNIKIIYDLLRVKKYTISGAKEYLKKYKSHEEKFALIDNLHNIKDFLLELKAHL